MQELLNWLGKNIVNGLISLLIFILCAVLGGVIAYITLLFLKSGKQKTRKKTTKSIESFVDKVVDDYYSQDVKLGKEKLTQLLSVASKLFEEIPKNYKSNVKYFEILKANDFDFLQKDVKISLEFATSESIRFLRATINALKEEVYLFLDNGVVKGLYGAGKVFNFFARFGDIPKNPEDLLVSEVLEIIEKISNPNKQVKKQLSEQKEKGLIKKGIEIIGGKAKDVGISFATTAVDKYLEDFIREFAQIINLLYSDGFKDEKQEKVTQPNSKKGVV